jgi:EAL domain-containing protein (putative c-di-GMP-specific phosphodiesterase class I)
VFEEAMHAQAQKRLRQETELRRAISQKEFVVYYQPKVLLESGRIKSVEALLRWQHPERGLLAPDEFVPVAKETGLVVPLGEVGTQGSLPSGEAVAGRVPDQPSSNG